MMRTTKSGAGYSIRRGGEARVPILSRQFMTM